MTTFATQTYNMLLQTLLFNITPVPVGAAIGTRGEVGTPENIPERCFIVDRVTSDDGFPTLADRNDFNGFIDHANKYHENFGFSIIRVKSFWQILDFYKSVTTDIGRIRIVTHGWLGWLQFPMFPGGNFNIGITNDQLDAFQNNDEEGLRWTFTLSKTNSPMIHDITTEIVDGMRKVNSALLAPLHVDTPGSNLTGDVKLFLDIVTDRYHMKFGSIVTQPTPTTFALLDAIQTSRLTAAIDYIEAEIRKRLEGAKLGTPPNTTTITKVHLDNLKAGILAETPAKLELIGAKKSLPTDIMAPVTTPGSLAHAMASVPKVENDLRIAISGGTSNLMFYNRTGEILQALATFHNSVLLLSSGVVIENWNDIKAIPDLEDFFFICNDLYMMKNGEFKITGGTDITDVQRTKIRDGLIAISEIIKSKITSGGSGITSGKLNTLRSTVENLSWQESKSTNVIKIIPVERLSELQAAVGGLSTGFRANLMKVRSLMSNDSFVDIRGCQIGSAPNFMKNMKNFLGTDAKKPIVSAPEWWQSYPPGVQYHGGTTSQKVFPRIDGMVNAGFASSHITKADVSTSFTLWKRLIDFDPHFAFISTLFADSDVDRFNFGTLEWRTWQAGGVGAGIPVLKMQAQRIDDITTLNIGDILERFRLIFEIPASSGLSVAERVTINALRPFIISFKTLKASANAAITPNAVEISQFYALLGNMGRDIEAIPGTTAPGTLLPPGVQNKANLHIYVNNVEAYIFNNLAALLGPFFARVRGQLNHPNKEIRYYCNIGLVLPVQSSSHPTMTNPVVMISYEKFGDRCRMFMDALRGWMKVQWKGSAAQAGSLNTFIDAIPVPTSLAAVGEFARRSVVSDGNPAGNPPGRNSHYCPTDEFGMRIKTES